MSLGGFWILGDIERMHQERNDKLIAEIKAESERERQENRRLRLMAVIADVRAYPGEECPENEFTTILLKNGIDPDSLTNGELYEINNSL